MKKQILILIATAIASFIFGLAWEYSAHRVEINDMLETANESCNVRISVIKETCK